MSEGTTIVSSTPTPALRWIRRGEDRILQQSFAVVTRENETGHLGSRYEWIEIPTFVETNYDLPPALPNVIIEIKRDRKHIEALIEEVVAKLTADSSDEKADTPPSCQPCRCGENDGYWCSLPGCPYAHPGNATKSSDSSGAPLTTLGNGNAHPTMPTREDVATVLRRFNGHLISHGLLDEMTAALKEAFPDACRAFEDFARQKAQAAAAKEIVDIFFGSAGSATLSIGGDHGKA